MEINQREVNFDLLRVIAMLMVVTTHFLGYSGIIYNITISKAKFNFIFVWLMNTISCSCVNLFILLTGYFLVNGKTHLKKLLNLECQVLFYSIFCFLITSGRHAINLESLIITLTPSISSTYYFLTNYIVLYLLSPFLNRLINNIDKQEYKKFILILILTFSIIPFVFFYSPWCRSGGPFSITWFIVVYFIGGYLKLYPMNKVSKKKIIFLYSILIIVLTLFSIIISNLLHSNNSIVPVEVLNKALITFEGLDSPFNIILTCLLFILFQNIFISNKIFISIIKFCSPCIFGVYLLHDNPYVRDILWARLKISNYMNDRWFIIYAIILIFIIFIIGIIVEKIRQKIFNLFKLKIK